MQADNPLYKKGKPRPTGDLEPCCEHKDQRIDDLEEQLVVQSKINLQDCERADRLATMLKDMASGDGWGRDTNLMSDSHIEHHEG